MSIKRTKVHALLIDKLAEVANEMEEILGDKQDSFNSKSEKGQEAQEDISTLEEIVNDLQNASDNMNGLFEEN